MTSLTEYWQYITL